MYVKDNSSQVTDQVLRQKAIGLEFKEVKYLVLGVGWWGPHGVTLAEGVGKAGKLRGIQKQRKKVRKGGKIAVAIRRKQLLVTGE
jgi:hypothetical protein